MFFDFRLFFFLIFILAGICSAKCSPGGIRQAIGNGFMRDADYAKKSSRTHNEMAMNHLGEVVKGNPKPAFFMSGNLWHFWFNFLPFTKVACFCLSSLHN